MSDGCADRRYRITPQLQIGSFAAYLTIDSSVGAPRPIEQGVFILQNCDAYGERSYLHNLLTINIWACFSY
jgi:hypothetical protein